MSDSTNNSSRRDVLKTIGGVLGGVSLLGHGGAQGQALGSMPNGYTFYRILNANQGGRFSGFDNTLADISGSVMMASPLSGHGIGYVYVHGTQTPAFKSLPALYEVAIDFSPTRPAVRRVIAI